MILMELVFLISVKMIVMLDIDVRLYHELLRSEGNEGVGKVEA